MNADAIAAAKSRTQATGTAAMMADIGIKARAAARPLALATTEAKNTALAAIAASIEGSADAILAANAHRHGSRPPQQIIAGIPRSPAADARSHPCHGRRRSRHRRTARSGRRGHRQLDAAERPHHRARAHAARRRRRHLREPAECRCRRRGAMSQGRQSIDPARRLGFAPFDGGDRRLPRRRTCRGKIAGGSDPGRGDHRPRRCRRNARRPERQSRRHRAARRQGAGRACPSRRRGCPSSPISKASATSMSM